MNKIKLSLTSLLVSLFMLLTLSGSAQTQSKHEVAVSYGLYTANEFANMFGTPVITFGLLTSDIKSSTGAVNISYTYRLNKVVALGGTYTYSAFKEDLFFKKTYSGSADNTFHSIMPTAKFNWFNSGMVSLYSKVAIGVTIYSITTSYTDENNTPVSASASSIGIGFQASPIGIEVGRKFAIFAEAGIGCMGTGQLGARLRF